MHTRFLLALVLKCLVLAPESMVRRVRVLRALLVGLALLTTEAKSPPLRRRLEQLDAALLPLGSSRFGVAPVPKFKSQIPSNLTSACSIQIAKPRQTSTPPDRYWISKARVPMALVKIVICM
jgi:hypothetical protein